MEIETIMASRSSFLRRHLMQGRIRTKHGRSSVLYLSSECFLLLLFPKYITWRWIFQPLPSNLFSTHVFSATTIHKLYISSIECQLALPFSWKMNKEVVFAYNSTSAVLTLVTNDSQSLNNVQPDASLPITLHMMLLDQALRDNIN